MNVEFMSDKTITHTTNDKQYTTIDISDSDSTPHSASATVTNKQYVEQLQNGNCYEVVESLEVACLKFAMSNLPQERTVVAQGPRYLAVHELHDKAQILANFKFSHAYVL